MTRGPGADALTTPPAVGEDARPVALRVDARQAAGVAVAVGGLLWLLVTWDLSANLWWPLPSLYVAAAGGLWIVAGARSGLGWLHAAVWVVDLLVGWAAGDSWGVWRSAVGYSAGPHSWVGTLAAAPALTRPGQRLRAPSADALAAAATVGGALVVLRVAGNPVEHDLTALLLGGLAGAAVAAGAGRTLLATVLLVLGLHLIELTDYVMVLGEGGVAHGAGGSVRAYGSVLHHVAPFVRQPLIVAAGLPVGWLVTRSLSATSAIGRGWGLVAAVNVVNVADAVSTWLMLKAGLAEELNPLMDHPAALVAKIVGVAAGSLLLRRVRPASLVIPLVPLLWVSVYHLAGWLTWT